MDGFDEEEIARAIALSLQETAKSQSKRPPEVIEIPDGPREVIVIDDDDDEPFPSAKTTRLKPPNARTAKASKVAAATSIPAATSSAAAPALQEAVQKPAKPVETFLSDRAQMERERLARQKRLRPDVVQNDTSDVEDKVIDAGAPSKKKHRPSVSVSSSSSNSSPSTSNTSASSDPSETLFWDGELRQTANAHVNKDKDTRPVFRLSEIIGPKDELVFAIISAYVINWPWLYGFFNPRTPVVVVTHDPKGEETIKEALPEWIRITPFLRNGYGCMHMKFMLFFYKSGRLRLVISTANLIEYDWRDMENTVWVQDVPLRSAPLPHTSKAKDFPTGMSNVLRAVNVLPALLTMQKNGHTNLPLTRVDDLRAKWDFSKVKVSLVPSIAGKHEGWSKVIETGHTRLMKAIHDLDVCAGKQRELVLELQGSSIGTYSTQWTNEFYCSARGESAETWLDRKSSRTKLPYPPLKILFPTLKTVRESALGERGGGTLFCRRNQWQAAKFPRDLFHDSRSKRGPALMHSKMIIGTFRPSALASSSKLAPDTESETEPEDDDVVEVSPKASNAIGWAYVGSHNFTPSAWGTLSGSAFNPILNITNYELGIVFPLKDEQELDRVACYERPPRKYTRDDIPWFQNESLYLRPET